MSDPTDSFPSNPDLYRLLAQMYGVGLFTPSPAPGSSGYQPQSTFDPSLALGLDSKTPGFGKSPAVLEALSANDPRTPGFYRSTALLGARALLPTPDPTLPPTIGPEAMLFGGPGSAPMLPPLPAPWSDYVRARYAFDPSQASTPDSGKPGFDKSPALLGTRALLPADSLTFSNSFGRERPTHGPGDIQLAAGGDLRCQGFSAGCPNGGSRGTTGWFSVEGRRVCESCAVRMLGLQDEPPSDPDRIRTLRWYMIRGGR